MHAAHACCCHAALDVGNDNLVTKSFVVNEVNGQPGVFTSNGVGFLITNNDFVWRVQYDSPWWYLDNTDLYGSGLNLYNPTTQRVQCAYSNSNRR